MRTVKTGAKTPATAVQIVWKTEHGVRRIEHLGSAHTVAEVELLKAAGRQRIAQVQPPLPFEEDGTRVPAALPILGSRMGRLVDGIAAGFRGLGLDVASGHDVVFEQLVTARIIEPSSKQAAARVLREAGVRACSYRTVKRRLRCYAEQAWRDRVSGACAAHATLGPAALCLYDVTTLWFDTDEGDGFREPGFSKERRLEPQITVGLLTDAAGCPLMIDAFEGNTAETRTMIPLVRRFLNAHGVTGLTVVADAGMLSEANMLAVEDAGWSFIVGGRLPEVPLVVQNWIDAHPGDTPPDGLILSAFTPTPLGARHPWRTFWQYRADRATRSLHGIDTQVAKAERQVAGRTPVKRNRFVQLHGGTRMVNRALELKARLLAGWKPYVTNTNWDADHVITAYHHLWHVEHAFRMSKHDLQARPIYHHTKESIDAHLVIVFAALAVSTWIEQHTGWTIDRFVKTLRCYREVIINTGTQTITAEDPVPADITTMLTRLQAH